MKASHILLTVLITCTPLVSLSALASQDRVLLCAKGTLAGFGAVVLATAGLNSADELYEDLKIADSYSETLKGNTARIGATSGALYTAYKLGTYSINSLAIGLGADSTALYNDIKQKFSNLAAHVNAVFIPTSKAGALVKGAGLTVLTGLTGYSFYKVGKEVVHDKIDLKMPETLNEATTAALPGLLTAALAYSTYKFGNKAYNNLSIGLN